MLSLIKHDIDQTPNVVGTLSFLITVRTALHRTLILVTLTDVLGWKSIIAHVLKTLLVKLSMNTDVTTCTRTTGNLCLYSGYYWYTL